ncbi:hypothetical protein B9Z55_008899 [Caenorhabditis nigoni]|uniref:Uncharacterized protein n=1 Tax=Caenorhabditis nigoni TaxID=1611254 RepID=A0A2G5UPY3_9PELO|nr:hypothetical protein B9Z55_008899 [Caenorhabditis nigoni]
MKRENMSQIVFYVGKIKLDIQSLRNTLPNLRRIGITCLKAEPDEKRQSEHSKPFESVSLRCSTPATASCPYSVCP